MRFSNPDAAQMHLFLEDKATLDDEHLFHDRNDCRFTLLAHGRNCIDGASNWHSLYLYPLMHKIFFDDLFMTFGSDSGANATCLNTPPLDRKGLGQQRNYVLFYAWSRLCITEVVLKFSSRHGCLQGIVQCRIWTSIRISRWESVGWRSPALHLESLWSYQSDFGGWSQRGDAALPERPEPVTAGH